MYHTSRKHWVNGWHVRGGSFWTLAFNIGKLGVMICKPSKDVPLINLYILD